VTNFEPTSVMYNKHFIAIGTN